jgi:hypothetical protein
MFNRVDAAERALDTFQDSEWEALGLRAGLFVLRMLKSDGADSVDPEKVIQVAASVVAEFAEGRHHCSVRGDLVGLNLVDAIIRELAPALRDRARGAG